MERSASSARVPLQRLAGPHDGPGVVGVEDPAAVDHGVLREVGGAGEEHDGAQEAADPAGKVPVLVAGILEVVQGVCELALVEEPVAVVIQLRGEGTGAGDGGWAGALRCGALLWGRSLCQHSLLCSSFWLAGSNKASGFDLRDL